MVELNELALENVVGGAESKIPQGVKEFTVGLAVYPVLPFLAAHDMVVPEEKVLFYEDAKLAAAGTILSAATYSALSVGVYEGGKHLYKKIKSKLSSK